jgi:hypothetical protein
MSILYWLSCAAGTLLRASVEAEFFGEEWHPVSTKYTNSTENVAVRATMCGRDIIDLRHDPR